MINPAQLLLSGIGATTEWVKKGFPIIDEHQLNVRKNICSSCEFWNASGFNNTGQCKKCGCSTYAKLRMATSKCPIDKWGSIEVENP